MTPAERERVRRAVEILKYQEIEPFVRNVLDELRPLLADEPETAEMTKPIWPKPAERWP